jgi:hypothetical protein
VATTDLAGEVIVLDLSVTGARIRHRKPITAGTPILMKARLDMRSIPLTFSGQVVWTRLEMGGDEQSWQSGIAFDSTVEALRPVIDRLFASRAVELLQSRYA